MHATTNILDRRDRGMTPMRRHLRWDELPRGSRVSLVVSAAAEIIMTTMAAVDLYRRPAEAVRGSKALWWPVIFIQPVGPPAYLLFGRRTDRSG